ncbi:MAG: hypothetical protein HYY20_13170 [Candidatus Tectomicrobia bacterium]|uniref:Electron transfer flavoprotein alpha/beta-subunit N-terminal domain-containing protein n=1 Tax=Tectimicrobiota bacterium TaxID=2528274 RepID=A0A932CR95_UNCTE|nr:hypothetical protein [Candidatus Tectomicrobia bacterium]
MELVVCLKVAPHPQDLRVDPGRRRLMREGLEGVLGPAEAAALELALELKGRYGGQVTVLSLGPPEATGILTRCLGVGVHRAHLLSGSLFQGSDARSTARALATAIGRLVPQHDLILCGTGSPDAGSGQIGPRLAAYLGVPQFCLIQEVSLEAPERRIQVQRKIEGGSLWEEGPLPAVLTVSPGLRELRRPSLRGAIQALRRRQEDFRLEDGSGWEGLGSVGEIGAALEVLEITPPRPRGYRKIDSKLSAAERFRMLTSGGSSGKKKERSAVIRGKPEEEAARELLEILQEQNVLGKPAS